MHRLPEGASLDVGLVEADTQGFHVVVGLTVSRCSCGGMDYAGRAADCAFYNLFVGILLALDFQIWVERRGAEPEVGVALRPRIAVHRYIRHVFKQRFVECLHVYVMGNVVVDYGHLSAADAGADVRHAVVVADGLVLVIRV